MYYLVFGVIYLLSLLPFWCLYKLSDFSFFVLYRLIGYRKEIVMQNLRSAFPNKREEELKKISISFYKNFCDVWIEMLKTMSISKRQIDKRLTYDYGILEALYKSGKSVQAYGGHFMNWEYANFTLPVHQPYTFLGVYMPLANQVFERIIFYMRSRFGSKMLKAGKMKLEMEAWKDRQYLIVLGADQSPASPLHAHWLYFMNRPAGFVQRPWQKARELNQPTVYLRVSKLKRGYYHFEAELFEMEPALLSEEALALKYKNMLEADILKYPDNYLWTHRRWKLGWKKEYSHLWIDEKQPPGFKPSNEMVEQGD